MLFKDLLVCGGGGWLPPATDDHLSGPVDGEITDRVGRYYVGARRPRLDHPHLRLVPPGEGIQHHRAVERLAPVDHLLGHRILCGRDNLPFPGNRIVSIDPGFLCLYPAHLLSLHRPTQEQVPPSHEIRRRAKNHPASALKTSFCRFLSGDLARAARAERARAPTPLTARSRRRPRRL